MTELPLSASPSVPNPSCGYPLKLEPIFEERVWGQEDLSFLYAARPNCPRRVGEVWLTGDTNRAANGPWGGTSLGELAERCGAALLGSRLPRLRPPHWPRFPLLVKFLFTSDKLSVQVHPPDFYAGQKEQSPGKTEMWHVLKAAAGARLAIGFREDLRAAGRPGAAALRGAVESGAIEEMLDWREVRQGETFFVPAGTVHALGPGLVLCEIQENSDITYRLFDYNRPGTDGRPRPLQVDKALDVLEWQTEGGRTVPLEWASGAPSGLCLAACPYFATEKVSLSTMLRGKTNERCEIWIGLDGIARLEAGGEEVLCEKGEVVVLPASAGAFSVHPISSATFLRTFPPDLEADVIRPLRARGYSDQQIRRVCFPPRTAPVARKK